MKACLRFLLGTNFSPFPLPIGSMYVMFSYISHEKKHLNVGINISYVGPSWDLFSWNRGAQNLLIDQRLRLKIADFGLVGDTQKKKMGGRSRDWPVWRIIPVRNHGQ